MFKNDFIFSVARIRAIESKLLSSAQIERMVTAANAKEAFRVLNDLEWASFLGEASKPEEFQEVLDAGMMEVKDLIDGAAEYSGEFGFLWGFMDLHNFKVLLKTFLKGDSRESVENLLSPLGHISRGVMTRIVFDGEKAPQEENDIQGFIAELKKHYEENQDPEAIDLMIEDRFMEMIQPHMRPVYTPMMRQFFARITDIGNITSFLRRADFSKKNNGFAYYIHGGNIAQECFIKAKNMDDFVKRLNPPKGISKIIQEELVNGKIESYIKLEIKLDEYLFEVLESSKLASDGPDPVFAYFWQKKRNAEIIRAIMIGKLNNVPEKQIRSWLKKPSLSLTS